MVEKDFRLRAGVVKDQRGLVAGDLVQDFRDGVAPAAPRPRGRCGGVEHGDVGVWAGIGGQDLGSRTKIGGEGRGIFDRRRQADAAQAGREGFQPGECEHQLIAALAFGECVEFVHHDALEARKDARGVFIAEQEREAFGGGEQDMRRVGALAAALGIGGVAGAVLDPDGKVGPFDRAAQVAADVGGERLEGRDVKGVEALMPICQFGQRGQKPRQRLAAPGGRDEQGGPCRPPRQHLVLMGVQGPALGGEPV